MDKHTIYNLTLVFLERGKYESIAKETWCMLIGYLFQIKVWISWI